ncbi:MAG: glycogen/starch synthase [Muribaculaceae bacterium]|nr:glycogen/starch synthase [Muribaculaceae bacterium]MDE5968103.1 glycogen/starch synthase [Muribaculaceae bacterium]
MENNKVLFIAQEINPYLPENPLSIIGRQVPQAIQENGYEVRTFMPKYGMINERRNQLHEVIRLSGLNIVIDDNDHPLIIKVATLQPSRMQIYFIDTEDYFMKSGAKELEIRSNPEDNDERIMFFVRGVIETVKKLRWEPAVVHSLGWIASLVPLYLKNYYAEDPSFCSSKVIFSLIDDAFEGTLDPRFVEKLKFDGFTDEQLQLDVNTPVDCFELKKLAIRHSDGVIQTTPVIDDRLADYARQIGKPFLAYDAEADMAKAYIDFYNAL